MQFLTTVSPLHLSLRSKIVLLAVLPLLLLTGVVWELGNTIEVKARQVRQALEYKIQGSTQQQLQYLMDMAFAVIEPVLADHTLTDEQQQQKVIRIVNETFFFGNKDGYFYLYDSKGVNLAHPLHPEFKGHNKSAELPMIKELLEQCLKNGEGFAHYRWKRPSSGQLEHKLGYARLLNKWGWMLGTGIYDAHTDVDYALQQASEEIWQTFHQVLWFFGGVILVIALLTFSVNWHESRLADRYLRTLTHNFVRLQEAERGSVARELHDGLNQLIVAAKFRIELVLRQMRRDGGDYQAGLLSALQTMDACMTEVRCISHGLRPALLDSQGLTAALECVVTAFAERTGVTVGLQLDDFSPEDEVAIVLFRVVQEALTNIERHAQATTVSLRLSQTPATLQLEVCDDGVGFDLNHLPAKQGIGLKNMRERVELLGGYWHLHSSLGLGTRLQATFFINT